jgi:hypothetical protein
VTGGYQNLLKMFLDNIFILDDHRFTLVPLQRMKQSRADHAILYFKNTIIVFGGMSHKAQSESTSDYSVESLASCEQYSTKDDKWLPFP